MLVKIKVKNNTETFQDVGLMNKFFPDNKTNSFNLNAIDVTCSVSQDGEKFVDCPYEDFIERCIAIPMMIGVNKSTNNRQLYFYWYSHDGTVTPCEPALDSDDGFPREKVYFKGGCDDSEWDDWEYKKAWNPKEWNIADTKEEVILDGVKFGVTVSIIPQQEFEIELYVVARKSVLPTIINKVKQIKPD